ncbi:hypothetical protein JNUCC42_08400 [Brevibacterium sp. JNUCC-42]|nr:hypothetical protein JNUCC42_08400 [Brevibacterium sp. JNUCC-42]
MAEVSVKINVDTLKAIRNIHALRSEAERALDAVEKLGNVLHERVGDIEHTEIKRDLSFPTKL